MFKNYWIMIILFIILGVQSNNAQGICVRDSIKVENVQGQIVAVVNGKETALTKAKIYLYESRGKKKLKESLLNENGHFSFPKVKRGNYILKVEHPNLPIFEVPLKVEKSTGSNIINNENEIVVTLGADLLVPCNGSKIEVREKIKN